MSWLFKDPIVIMKKIMSWLFKDPIVTVVWLNFYHAQSNSKKWSKKIKLPQIRFILEKQLIEFSYNSWPLLLSKIKNKKTPECRSKVMGQYHFPTKMTYKIALNKIFSEIPLISLCKIVKQQMESSDNGPFWVLNGQFVSNKIFSEKPLI